MEEEKTYKVMSASGACSIVLGVVSLVVGVTTGILLIIQGAKLISLKGKVTF